MDLADTSTAFVASNTLCGAIITYRPSGITINNPVGMGFLLLCSMQVMLIFLVSYPIDPDVDISGSNSTTFVKICDFILTS